MVPGVLTLRSFHAILVSQEAGLLMKMLGGIQEAVYLLF